MRGASSSTANFENCWINMEYIIITHIIVKQKQALLNDFCITYKAVLYRMMTEKNTNKFLSHHKKIISSYNRRPHNGLNDRTPHYVHFLNDIKKST